MPHVAFHTFLVPEFSSLAFSAPPILLRLRLLSVAYSQQVNWQKVWMECKYESRVSDSRILESSLILSGGVIQCLPACLSWLVPAAVAVQLAVADWWCVADHAYSSLLKTLRCLSVLYASTTHDSSTISCMPLHDMLISLNTLCRKKWHPLKSSI